ncbi:MAG: AmmeMemoRadiSam system radical SAM enzyme [bacterium]
MLRQPTSRRGFLQRAVRFGVSLGGAGWMLGNTENLLHWLESGRMGPGDALAAEALADLIRKAPRARFWTSTAADQPDCGACHDAGSVDLAETYHHQRSGLVKCLLCALNCEIEPGERGHCRARINVDGELRTLVYGRPMSTHIDPIEKKPFYHFLPGQQAFSLATSGCPLRCKFCQNWQISQASPEDYQAQQVPPGRIVAASEERNVPVIAFTYNEPTVFHEYLTDIARLARRQNIRSVLISCGYMNEAPLAEMCEVLDAIKIDLKGYDAAFYREVCGAELQPVLRSIRQVARSDVHLELVNLVVPTLNDNEMQLTELARWVAGELGPDVPLHFTRFHPDYQLMHLPATPVATLERARDIALDSGIRYAFVGNVPGHAGNHTYCPRCGEIVIERQGFFVTDLQLQDGRCAACEETIAGVWK